MSRRSVRSSEVARGAAIFASSALVAASAGCGPSRPATTPPSAVVGSGACRIGDADVDLVGWEPTARAALETARREGVVALKVDRDACKVEVVRGCAGKGAYKFAPYVEEKRVVARDRTEVGAAFPLGGAALSAKVAKGESVLSHVRLVGVASLPSALVVTRADLVGETCADATHVAASVYLGGFVLASSTSTTAKGGGKLLGFGADVTKEHGGETLDAAGDPEACATASRDGKETPLCSAPLRVALLPVRDAAPDLGQKDGPRPEPPKPVLPKRPAVGARVSRGPDWKWGEQDKSGPGTIVHDPDNGWVEVEWPDKTKNAYRFGAEGKIDLREELPLDAGRTQVNVVVFVPKADERAGTELVQALVARGFAKAHLNVLGPNPEPNVKFRDVAPSLVDEIVSAAAAFGADGAVRRAPDALDEPRALYLNLPKGLSLQVCGLPAAEYGSLAVGSVVVVGRHRPVDGDASWSDEMDETVGKEARVTALRGLDRKGCPGVALDVDEGRFHHRIRDLARR